MVFSSSVFLFGFLPILLVSYYFISDKWKNVVLLIASLLFYAWGEPKNIVIMLVSIVVNYVLSILIETKEKYSKLWMIVSVVYDLGILFVFKYLNFTVDIINSITKKGIVVDEIALPIGISFYTFQIMSYVIDVYKKDVKAQKSILDLALYISLFPQLIAGPIVRYVDIEKQIKTRSVNFDSIYIGMTRFIIGFSKKILLADQLSLLVDIVFAENNASIFSNWIGIIAYALQIYYDFSGYSDMAIGLGKIFGFDFLENFNYPYISQSIQEFWRRWHISLSSWFRDYVYIPLGGSRKGKIRTYLNLIIVFFLTGLWHGASWNFIVWGLFYVLFLIIERLGFKNILIKLPRVIRHIYALFVILIGWVFFRADTLMDALIYIKGMFTISGQDVAYFNYDMNGQYWFCIIVGIILVIPYKNISKMIEEKKQFSMVSDFIIIAVFIVAICYLIGSGYSPFLYFRF